MRHELSGQEWSIIRTMLPTRPRGAPRVDDRRGLNGILWVLRIPIPCRRDRDTATGGPDAWWPTPEPPHRINQLYLEPLPVAHAGQVPQVTIINCISVGALAGPIRVSALARELKSGETFNIEARYLVGCDGAPSSMRKAIGANLAGTPVIQSVQSTYISFA